MHFRVHVINIMSKCYVLPPFCIPTTYYDPGVVLHRLVNSHGPITALCVFLW